MEIKKVMVKCDMCGNLFPVVHDSSRQGKRKSEWVSICNKCLFDRAFKHDLIYKN